MVIRFLTFFPFPFKSPPCLSVFVFLSPVCVCVSLSLCLPLSLSLVCVCSCVCIPGCQSSLCTLFERVFLTRPSQPALSILGLSCLHLIWESWNCRQVLPHPGSADLNSRSHTPIAHFAHGANASNLPWFPASCSLITSLDQNLEFLPSPHHLPFFSKSILRSENRDAPWDCYSGQWLRQALYQRTQVSLLDGLGQFTVLFPKFHKRQRNGNRKGKKMILKHV